MEKISKETETKLVRSLEKVADFVSNGDSPSAAIVKVAKEDDLGAGHVQLVVQAYNNARFNRQRKSSSLLEEKVAHFDLADPVAIHEELYPSNVKQAHQHTLEGPALSDDYSRPPQALEPDRFMMSAFTKTASHTRLNNNLPREYDFVKKAHSLLREVDVEHSERRRLLSRARDKVAESFDDLDTYFRGVSRLPFGEVKEAAAALYGAQAQPIFKHLEELNPRLLKDRAGHYKQAVDRNRPPYSLIEACLEKVGEYESRFTDLGKFSKEAGAATLKVMQQFMPLQQPPVKGSLIGHLEKQATEKVADLDIAGPLSSIGGHLASHAISQQVMKGMQPREPDKMENKSLLKLMDPAHEQKLRGIRAQATFHDMMANDEFLSGADPQHVAKLYNEFARISPRSVDQPLLMRALLRRHLAQGQMDPHDVEQLASMEGKLKERENPIAPAALPGEEAPTP